MEKGPNQSWTMTPHSDSFCALIPSSARRRRRRRSDAMIVLLMMLMMIMRRVSRWMCMIVKRVIVVVPLPIFAVETRVCHTHANPHRHSDRCL